LHRLLIVLRGKEVILETDIVPIPIAGSPRDVNPGLVMSGGHRFLPVIPALLENEKQGGYTVDHDVTSLVTDR
jgi:hypothetical protein